MLVIDSNLQYLQKVLGISETKFVRQYALMSVDEILEAEAAQGNQKAIELAKELTSNAGLIIKLFELADQNNKYMILRELSARDLQVFLPEMEDSDLLQGLFFFTQESLLKMLEEVPKEELVKTAFEMFSKEQIVQLMPEDQLDKFLTSTDIGKGKVLKHLESIPPEYVAQVLEQVTGEDMQEMDIIDMSKRISQLSPTEYKDVLLAFQPEQKQQLVTSLAKEHNEWYQIFDTRAYTNMFRREKHQPEIVKAMSVIEPEHIQNMIKELPNDLLSIVITQIDTQKFAEILMNEFPEIIASIVMNG